MQTIPERHNRAGHVSFDTKHMTHRVECLHGRARTVTANVPQSGHTGEEVLITCPINFLTMQNLE